MRLLALLVRSCCVVARRPRSRHSPRWRTASATCLTPRSVSRAASGGAEGGAGGAESEPRPGVRIGRSSKKPTRKQRGSYSQHFSEEARARVPYAARHTPRRSLLAGARLRAHAAQP
jgi:hypothetical protein